MTSPLPLFQKASEWPIVGEYDVAVFGAGPAGIGAACAAGKLGARTILVEQLGFPGGVATAACCPYLMGFGHGGRQIVGGVADELVRELDAMGHARFMTTPCGTPEPRPIGNRDLTTNVIVSVEGLRVAANRVLERAGVCKLYYTSLVGAVTESDRVLAAAVNRKEGLGLIRARAFVDATGDADLVWRAGGEVRDYAVEESMTKSLLLRVGGVPHFHRGAVEEVFARLVAEGKVPFRAQDRFMGFALLNPGEVLLNFTLIAGNGLSSEDLTRMDGELREQALVAVEWFRREVPHFAHCFLVDVAAQVGVRAGRGIVGLETITPQDLDDNTPVPEPVALGQRSYGGHGLTGFAPAWHKSNPGLRGVPWRTLLSASFVNVATGGRSVSCDPRALDSLRLMSRCMATGQAAGVSAALAARADGAILPVGYASVRESLLGQDAILE